MSGEQVVELTTHVLGLNPYVVLETRPDPESEQGFDVKVMAGGGITASDDMVALLLLVVESLTGVSTDDYALLVDAARRAAGTQE